MGKVINFRGKLSTEESVENLIREAESGNIEEDGASKFMLAGAMERLRGRFWNEQFD